GPLAAPSTRFRSAEIGSYQSDNAGDSRQCEHQKRMHSTEQDDEHAAGRNRCGGPGSIGGGGENVTTAEHQAGGDWRKALLNNLPPPRTLKAAPHSRNVKRQDEGQTA